MEIIYSMPHEEYLAYPALSKSAIDNFLISPAHYKYYKDNPKPQTESMRFGSMLHTAILKPDIFHSKYQAISGDGRTKEYKALAQEIRANNKEPVNESDFHLISDMRQALYDTKRFNQLISGAETEVSIFWTEEIEGIKIPCKARIDIVSDKDILADYKTTTSAYELDFIYSIKKYNYDIQAAWYQRGWASVTKKRPLGFCFIAEEKTPPYGVGFYNIPDLKIPNMMIEKVLYDVAMCEKNNDWPCYPDKIVDLYIRRF